MQMTHHAEERRAQRNLPLEIVQLIQAHGSPRHCHGALSLMLDDATIDLIAEGDLRRRQALCRYRGTYIIESPQGAIITTARQTRRLRRR